MTLADFVAQSNAIEGIVREPTAAEIAAHEAFLEAGPSVESLVAFVTSVASARLRVLPGMDVRVGHHLPPRGGPEIAARLEGLCLRIRGHRAGGPWAAHLEYETLHPFTDGNGRSGRALWVWMRGGLYALDQLPPLGFLHAFYYETLQGVRPG